MNTQRRKLIVNPRLQYREALVASSVAVISVNLLLIVGTLFPERFGVSVKLTAQGYLLVGGAGVLLLLAVWVASIRRSHKVAGAVYAIVREVTKIAGGDLSFSVRLRPGDELQDEARRINDAALQLSAQLRAIKAVAEKMHAVRDLAEVHAELEQLTALLALLKTDDAGHV